MEPHREPVAGVSSYEPPEGCLRTVCASDHVHAEPSEWRKPPKSTPVADQAGRKLYR